MEEALSAGPAVEGRPEPDEHQKQLVKDWRKRIDAALERNRKTFKEFEDNRQRLRGRIPGQEKKVLANLHFANMAALRPQVYAKDPEFAIDPADGIPPEQVASIRKLGEVSEAVLKKKLVQECRLKKRAKRALNSTYTTAVGWWKLGWQDGTTPAAVAQNPIKDSTDNIKRIEMLADDAQEAGMDQQLKEGQLIQTVTGLQAQAEIRVGRGLTLDFVLTEDVLILDESVFEVADYERASAIAVRVWMTRDRFKATFGYAPKGKAYISRPEGKVEQQTAQQGPTDLFCAWEIWEQDSNRVFHVCDGDPGFCQEPFSPNWTGKRWYPLFALIFNEVDGGGHYPPSDIELTNALVDEYNEARKDLVNDRRAALPLNVVRSGGNLKPGDVENLKNRKGADIIVVDGVGGKLEDDIFSGTLAQLNPANYDTAPARSDIEQILGGGDAARGAVLKAKTATEAEIVSQGLRGRSAERTDVIEDLLSELGEYALQVCLRMMNPDEVAQIAGPEAADIWPAISTPEQVFEQLQVTVRGGSTGRPDRLQEQDRWTKLLPVIEKTVEQVSKLRAEGQTELAQALVLLCRETLKRFDERLDIEQFLPPAPTDGQPDPMQVQQEYTQLKQQVTQMQGELQKKEEAIQRGFVQAATQMGLSPMPLTAASAMTLILEALMQGRVIDPPAATEVPAANDPSIPPQPDSGSAGAPFPP